MKRIIPVTEALPSQLMAMTNMLNFDDRLMEDIGIKKGDHISVPEFVAFNAQWAKARGADIYLIIDDYEESAGMITVTFLKDNETARCGYWLGSDYRGKGLGREAFAEIVDIVKKRGCGRLEATIAKDNEISRKIWEPYGAEFLDLGDNYKAVIVIDSDSQEE